MSDSDDYERYIGDYEPKEQEPDIEAFKRSRDAAYRPLPAGAVLDKPYIDPTPSNGSRD